MEVGEDGEYACCGVFTPGFVSNLTRADVELSKEHKAAVNKLIKTVGQASRELLRKHSEIGRIGVVLAKSTQISILPFLTRVPSANKADQANKEGKKKKRKRSSPPGTVEAKDTKVNKGKSPAATSTDRCVSDPRRIYSDHVLPTVGQSGLTHWRWGS